MVYTSNSPIRSIFDSPIDDPSSSIAIAATGKAIIPIRAIIPAIYFVFFLCEMIAIAIKIRADAAATAPPAAGAADCQLGVRS